MEDTLMKYDLPYVRLPQTPVEPDKNYVLFYTNYRTKWVEAMPAPPSDSGTYRLESSGGKMKWIKNQG